MHGHYSFLATQEKDDVEAGIGPLCDGGSETGSLASKATASNSNGSASLKPMQPCAHLSTSDCEGAGEDSSTSVGEPTSLAKFDVLRFQNGFLEVRVV